MSNTESCFSDQHPLIPILLLSFQVLFQSSSAMTSTLSFFGSFVSLLLQIQSNNVYILIRLLLHSSLVAPLSVIQILKIRIFVAEMAQHCSIPIKPFIFALFYRFFIDQYISFYSFHHSSMRSWLCCSDELSPLFGLLG